MILIDSRLTFDPIIGIKGSQAITYVDLSVM